MDKPKQKELMRRRAFALAEVLLSGQSGVQYQLESAETGISYLVRLTSHSGLRQLGVGLCYAWSKQSDAGANSAVRRVLRVQREQFSPFPFPVVLFFFTMEDNAARYTWVAEPVVVEGKPILTTPDPDCHQLDTQALDHIILRTGRWYDAYFATIAPAEPATVK